MSKRSCGANRSNSCRKTAAWLAAATSGGDPRGDGDWRATIAGDQIDSQYLQFEPRPVSGGDYHFAIGIAGSATLVLQTGLPSLLIANAPSTLILEGGTHNPWAAPFDFLQRVFVPLVERMGPRLSLELDRYGFYPAGGGRFRARIEPTASLHTTTQLEVLSRVLAVPIQVTSAPLTPVIPSSIADPTASAADDVIVRVGRAA